MARIPWAERQEMVARAMQTRHGRLALLQATENAAASRLHALYARHAVARAEALHDLLDMGEVRAEVVRDDPSCGVEAHLSPWTGEAMIAALRSDPGAVRLLDVVAVMGL